MRRALLAVLLVAGALAAVPATAPARTLSVTVPLDRTGRVPGNVRLFAERIPVAGPRDGVLVALVGGPGQSGSAARVELLRMLRPALRGRDLVVFDPRGTGSSGVIRCPELDRAREPAPEPATACANRLGERRGSYTSAETVADLESLRRALRVRRMSIYAVSYGTRVALDYARAHPGSVERLVLDSPVPAEGADPFQRSTFAAIPRVLREVCGGGACRAITADPVADLRELVARLRANPLVGHVADSRGRQRRRELRVGGLFGLLLLGDLEPSLRSDLPAAATAALAADPRPLLRLAERAGRVAGGPEPLRTFSTGAFAATMCEETLFPWARDSALADRPGQAADAAARLPEGTFDPFGAEIALASPLLRLCAGWPAASAPPEFAGGSLPAVRALVIGGREDLRTPLEDAGRVAARLPGSASLSVPFTGHSVLASDLTGCAAREVRQFLAGRLLAPCRSGRRPIPVAPRLPRLLSEVPPARGMSGTPGRAATAVALTVQDAARQSVAWSLAGRRRAGGLRGGYFRPAAGDGLALRRYEVLRDLTVTTTVGARRPARVLVGGVAGERLRLTRGGTLTGTIGGQRVRLRVAVPRVLVLRGGRARLAGGPAVRLGR